jgi:Ni/Co efflux regulator RcnB
MNVLARPVLLLAAAMALAAPPAMSQSQPTIKVPPKGGLIPSGPSSMTPRGPNGEIAGGPSGSAVRGPNSGFGPPTSSGAAAAAQPGYRANTRRSAYGAPTGHAFHYGGRTYYAVYAPAFVYPHGLAYRRWAVGAVLPAALLTKTYVYADYASLGLPRPGADRRWIRYGPDLLLVNVHTGAVVHSAHGAFEER